MNGLNLEKIALESGAQHVQGQRDLVLGFTVEALFARAVAARWPT